MSSSPARAPSRAPTWAAGSGSGGAGAAPSRTSAVDRAPSPGWASGLRKPTRTPRWSSARTSPRQAAVRPTPWPVGTASTTRATSAALRRAHQPGGLAGDGELLVRRHHQRLRRAGAGDATGGVLAVALVGGVVLL